MPKLTNDQVRAALEQRTRLEDSIRELGGTVPQPWPWDDDGMLRNVQLMEARDKLKRDRPTR